LKTAAQGRHHQLRWDAVAAPQPRLKAAIAAGFVALFVAMEWHVFNRRPQISIFQRADLPLYSRPASSDPSAG